MHDELKILQRKYAEITSNSIEINHRYYHDALEKTNYQKISKGPLLNIRLFKLILPINHVICFDSFRH